MATVIVCDITSKYTKRDIVYDHCVYYVDMAIQFLDMEQ